MADLVTSGTTTYIVGTSSGIDTATLVEVAVQSKTRKADRIDVEVEDNQATISAYKQLSTLATNLQDSLDALVVLNDLDSEDTSVFDQKTGFLRADDGSDPSRLLNVSLEDGIDSGEYEVIVEQQAKTMKVASNTTLADDTAALGYDGTFSIGLDGMTSFDVAVTTDMSLDDIADAINAQKDTTGVGASIIEVSSGSFQLVLTGTETAQSITTSVVSGDDVLQGLGITDGAGAFTTTIRNAQQAIIEVDGITITRDENTFDDVIDGITFSIEGADPDTTLTLEITNDTSGVKEAIQAFVDAYNALRAYVVSQQNVSEEGEASGALFSDTILENLNFLVVELIGENYTDNGVVQGLSDVGVTFGSNNYLVVDETALDDAILDNFDELVDLFTTDTSFSQSNLSLVTNNSTSSFDFTIDITTDGGGNITGASVGGDSSLFTVSGTRLIGVEGSAYEGLTFSYQGGVDASIDIEINQGLAEALYNVVDVYTNATDGVITEEILAIEDVNTELEAEASLIRSRAEDFRLSEIERYAEMESRIAALELQLKQIRAILGTDDDDD